MSDLIWVRPRESDIADCKELFSGCIAFFGDHAERIGFEGTKPETRINHNDERGNRLALYNEACMLKALDRTPDARFMFYHTAFASQLDQKLLSKVICKNDFTLLSALDDKGQTRLAASRIIPTVPYASVRRLSTESLTLPPGDTDAVVQVRRSSGGFGTFVVRREEASGFFLAHPEITSYIVSPYYEGAPSINVHFFINKGRTYALPGSVQLVREIGGKLLYAGADFDAYGEINPVIVRRAEEYGCRFLNRYVADKFIGVIGIDYLIVEGEPLFTEVNPRFQASTPLLNKALVMKGLPSLQEMQMGAFAGIDYAEELIEASRIVPGQSFVSYVPEMWNRPDIYIPSLAGDEGIESVSLDGYHPGQPAEAEAHLFKLTFSRRISSVDEDGALRVHENLFEEDSHISRAVLNGDARAAKISLVNQGVRISRRALEGIRQTGGSEGRGLLLD